jgi:hypothetical protein
LKKPKKPTIGKKLERSIDPNEDPEINNLMNGLGETVERKDHLGKGVNGKSLKTKTTGMVSTYNEEDMKQMQLDRDRGLNANAMVYDQDLEVDPNVDGMI